MNSILSYFADKGQGTVRLDLSYQPGLALVTLDNATRHNSLSGKMMVEFHHIITQLERNNHDNNLVGVLFIGASLKSFCAGLDLSFGREFLKEPQDALRLNELMFDVIDRLTKLPLITMGVVVGGCIGGGSELVTAFDFVCMSLESGFVHFVQTRMGVSSPWGGMRRLVEIVGKKKALVWMAGGKKVRAEEGVRSGFVDLVVEKDIDCLDRSVGFLQMFLKDQRSGQRVDPCAVRGMKRLAVENDGDWEVVRNVLASTVFSKL